MPPWTGSAMRSDIDQLLPQLLDLVAHLRRRLELQVPRVLIHLFFQLADALGDFRWRAQLLYLVAGRLLGGLRLAPLVRATTRHHRALENILHTLDHTLGRDAMLEVETDLLVPAPFGFTHGPLHRAGHAVSIEDCLAV